MSETNNPATNGNCSGVRGGLYHTPAPALQKYERPRDDENLRREPARDSAVTPAARTWPLTAAAVAALVISVAPTLYDFIYVTLSNQMLHWLASLGSAAFIGLVITWGAVGGVEVAGQLDAARWGGLLGGIMVGVGLAILRVAHAKGGNELAFAVALTAVESLGTKIWRMSRD